MSFFFYLAQVSIYGLIMWGIYCVVWRNKAIHLGSRLYLLLSTGLPLVVPLIQISTDSISIKGIQRILLPDILVSPAGNTQATVFQTGSNTAVGLYFAISLAIACVYLSAYRKLYAKLKQGVALKYQHYTIITNTGIGPGTIGRRIFFAGQELDNLIIQHELAHIQAGHRFDVAFIQLLRIIFWVSPVVWLIGRELKTVHEFEADAAAAGVTDIETYSNKLLAQTFSISHAQIFHSFFHHPVKRRILMLQKNLQKTRTSAYTIATAVVLTLAFTTSALIGQTSKKTIRPQKNNQQKEARKANSSAPVASKNPGGGTTFQYVDQQPKFDGNLSEFLSGQLHYPDSARAHNQQGRCVVKFVVDKQGKIVSPELVRSSGFNLLDDEAMRVIGIMPSWKPGRQKGVPAAVYFTLPVTFKLDN